METSKNFESPEVRSTSITLLRKDTSVLSTVSLGTMVRDNIQNKFKFEKTLGEGAFGKVKTASLRDDPTKKFAIKSMERKFFESKVQKIAKPSTNYEDEDSNMEETMQEMLQSEL